MTVLLCYLKSEGKYSEKLKTACKRTLAHIPEVVDILRQIHGSKASYRDPSRHMQNGDDKADE